MVELFASFFYRFFSFTPVFRGLFHFDHDEKNRLTDAQDHEVHHCPLTSATTEINGPRTDGAIANSPMHADPKDAVNIFVDTKCKKALGMHWVSLLALCSLLLTFAFGPGLVLVEWGAERGGWWRSRGWGYGEPWLHRGNGDPGFGNCEPGGVGRE